MDKDAKKLIENYLIYSETVTKEEMLDIEAEAGAVLDAQGQAALDYLLQRLSERRHKMRDKAVVKAAAHIESEGRYNGEDILENPEVIKYMNLRSQKLEWALKLAWGGFAIALLYAVFIWTYSFVRHSSGARLREIANIAVEIRESGKVKECNKESKLFDELACSQKLERLAKQRLESETP